MKYFVLDRERVPRPALLMEWGEFYDNPGARRVGETLIFPQREASPGKQMQKRPLSDPAKARYRVSTYFIGMSGKIFETTWIDPMSEEEYIRGVRHTASWSAAEKAHAAMVKRAWMAASDD